jgi:hypothetical protein
MGTMFGGARRDRTAGLYNAIVALSQLSYSPIKTEHSVGARDRSRTGTEKLRGIFIPATAFTATVNVFGVWTMPLPFALRQSGRSRLASTLSQGKSWT